MNHPRVKIVTEQADKGFYELVIADVQKQDAGKYSCTAKNRFGEASCEATVTVSDEKMLYLPEDFLEPGMEPQFTWLRDGKPFDPEERFKVLFKDNEDTLALVFQHVKPEDAGLYTCVAQTSTGNNPSFNHFIGFLDSKRPCCMTRPRHDLQVTNYAPKNIFRSL